MKRNVLFPLASLMAVLVPVLVAAAPRASSPKTSGPKAVTVDLFKAMEAGDIDVRIIPKDSKQATVLIENKTKKPLHIKLPAGFAGVPVLAQPLGGNNNIGGGNNNNNNINQGIGGGFGGGLGGGLGGGGLGGFGGGAAFNVGPDKIGKIKVRTVCLEHGKKEPNPRIAYQLKPIESFTDKPEVIEVCKMLGRGEIDQASAQAAAWHYTNGLSWEQLARKIGIKHLNGTTEPYFTPLQIVRAARIAAEATRRAKSRPAGSLAEK